MTWQQLGYSTTKIPILATQRTPVCTWHYLPTGALKAEARLSPKGGPRDGIQRRPPCPDMKIESEKGL